MADTDDTRSNDARRRTEDNSGGPQQRVRRLGSEQESGPFFPSGMSAPEAAIAGATAGMSDDQVRQVEQDFVESGAPTDGTVPDMSGVERPDSEGETESSDAADGSTADGSTDAGSTESDRPAQGDPKADWEEYRRGQGHDVDGLTKQELIDLD